MTHVNIYGFNVVLVWAFLISPWRVVQRGPLPLVAFSVGNMLAAGPKHLQDTPCETGSWTLIEGLVQVHVWNNTILLRRFFFRRQTFHVVPFSHAFRHSRHPFSNLQCPKFAQDLVVHSVKLVREGFNHSSHWVIDRTCLDVGRLGEGLGMRQRLFMLCFFFEEKIVTVIGNEQERVCAMKQLAKGLLGREVGRVSLLWRVTVATVHNIGCLLIVGHYFRKTPTQVTSGPFYMHWMVFAVATIVKPYTFVKGGVKRILWTCGVHYIVFRTIWKHFCDLSVTEQREVRRWYVVRSRHHSGYYVIAKRNLQWPF